MSQFVYLLNDFCKTKWRKKLLSLVMVIIIISVLAQQLYIHVQYSPDSHTPKTLLRSMTESAFGSQNTPTVAINKSSTVPKAEYVQLINNKMVQLQHNFEYYKRRKFLNLPDPIHYNRNPRYEHNRNGSRPPNPNHHELWTRYGQPIFHPNIARNFTYHTDSPETRKLYEEKERKLMYNPQYPKTFWDSLDNIISGNNNQTVNMTIMNQLLADFLPAQLAVSVGMEGQHISPTHMHFFLRKPTLRKPQSLSSLLIFVGTEPRNYKRRMTIRDTWGSKSRLDNLGAQLFFVTGLDKNPTQKKVLYKACNVEADQFRDILLLNMTETYDSLPYKGILAMTWIATKQHKFNYIIKTDDDVILNVFGWHKFVEEFMLKTNRECATAGYEYTYRTPRRQFIGKAEYIGNAYRPFLAGWAYLMTRAAMVTILRVSYRLPMLKREDVFFTGIVASQTDITQFKVPAAAFPSFDKYQRYPTNMYFLASHRIRFRVDDSQISNLEAWLKSIMSNIKVTTEMNHELPKRFVLPNEHSHLLMCKK